MTKVEMAADVSVWLMVQYNMKTTGGSLVSHPMP